MFLFEHTRTQLQRIEDKLGAMYQNIDALLNTPNGILHVGRELRHNLHELRACRVHLNLQHEVTRQLNQAQSLAEVIHTALDAIWLKAPLSFAVIILGESELGPYQYRGMKGISNSWCYLNRECPFPLSGVLARALLQRLDPTEPDYLYVSNLKTAERPTSDEFPWVPHQGSLLILPLRGANIARGALLLGRNEPDGFAAPSLIEEYQGITTSITRAIEHAQMKEEVHKNAEQLVDAQLLTREITNAHHFDAVINALTQKLPEVMGWVDVQVVVRKPHHALDRLAIGQRPHCQSSYALGSPGNASDRQGSPAEAESSGLLDNHFFAQSQSCEQEPIGGPEIQHLFRWAMEVGEPIFYDPTNLENDPEHPYYSGSGRALIVPINSKNHTFGVIHVVLRDPLRRFDESDMIVLRTIANSTATALHNVELIHIQEWERIESMSTLIRAAENRTPLLQGHNQRVTHNSAVLAHYLGFTSQLCLQIRGGAALHDIALIQLSDDEVQQLYGDAWDTPQAAHLRAQKSSQILAQAHIDKTMTAIVEQQGTLSAQTEMALVDPLSPIGGRFSQSAWASPAPPRTETSATVSHRNCHFPHSEGSDSPSMAQGAAILAVVDAFDMVMCRSRQNSSPDPLVGLDYMRSHAGVRFDPTIIQAYSELIAQNHIQFPT